MPVRIHPNQVGASEETYQSLGEQLTELEGRFNEERIKRTVVYYFSAIRQYEHQIDLHVPFKGKIVQGRVYSHAPVDSYLRADITKNEESLHVENIDAGVKDQSFALNLEVNHEAIAVKLESGELGMENVSVYLDLIPE